MHIVICLDDRNGMMFNKRRLSADKTVCRRIVEQATGKLWMSSYSAGLFGEYPVCIDEDFLEHAGQEDTCFAETPDFVRLGDKISALTIYRWNRAYPSDQKLPEEFLALWQQVASLDFPGNSHDTVTEERYTK